MLNKKKVDELLNKYDNNRYLRQIFEVRKWRIRKLTMYSIFIQLFITLRLSVLESKFRRLLVFLNLSQNDERNESPHLYERRFRRRLEMNEELKKQIQIFGPDMEEIIDSLTYNAINLLEKHRTEENSIVVDFLQNIYDNFDYTLYNVPSDAYIEESRRFETEAIAMQKEKIKKLVHEKKMEHHEAETLLRDLNYNEALLYNSHEE